jgi:hypothetical protein
MTGRTESFHWCGRTVFNLLYRKRDKFSVVSDTNIDCYTLSDLESLQNFVGKLIK